MTSLLRLCVLVILALLAFAANSVLCRLALHEGLIAPAQFTLWRLLSEVMMLLILCGIQYCKPPQNNVRKVWIEGSWLSALALFIYALAFSYAYVTLSTGIGALILFAAMQLTLIIFAIWTGQKLVWLEWLGLAIAFAGFVYLVLPSLSSPSVLGFVLMTLAGAAWGLYTWRGSISAKPLLATTSNFVRTLPMLLIALVVIHFNGESLPNAQPEGIMLAVTSGAIMSALGYAIWYVVLPHLSVSIAAALQLIVPVIAAVAGVFFANEAITLHLLIASLSVLGGVLLVIFARNRMRRNA